MGAREPERGLESDELLSIFKKSNGNIRVKYYYCLKLLFVNELINQP